MKTKGRALKRHITRQSLKLNKIKLTTLTLYRYILGKNFHLIRFLLKKFQIKICACVCSCA